MGSIEDLSKVTKILSNFLPEVRPTEDRSKHLLRNPKVSMTSSIDRGTLNNDNNFENYHEPLSFDHFLHCTFP
jgi:hypothetical protein